MLRTSEQLPFAMFKKLMNLASEPDSDHSAMLFIIDTEDLWIWSLKPQSLQVVIIL